MAGTAARDIAIERDHVDVGWGTLPEGTSFLPIIKLLACSICLPACLWR